MELRGTDLANYGEGLLWSEWARSAATLAGDAHSGLEVLRLRGLANLYDKMGRYEDAERSVDEASALVDEHLGHESSAAADVLSLRAHVAYGRGDFEHAIALWTRKYTWLQEVLGGEHPIAADTLDNIANSLSRLERHEEALVKRLEALAIIEQVYRPDHRRVSFQYMNTAASYSDLERYPEAITFSSKALAIQERVLGHEHPTVAMTLSILGDAYGKTGDIKRAIEHCERAVAIHESVETSPLQRALSWELLAKVLWDARPDEGQDRHRAVALMRKAREGFFRVGKPGEKYLERADEWLKARSSKVMGPG